ncbi:MAG: hypothetical protein WCI39_11700 [Gallionellaceae bacterium]
MFMINGIVGLDLKEIEDLQIASSVFESNIYESNQLRHLLKQTIQHCKYRQQKISGKDLTGERPLVEDERWDSFGNCLIATMLMETCLNELDILTGNRLFEDSEDQGCLAENSSLPLSKANLTLNLELLSRFKI